jgi:hypothetical protein
MLSGFTIFDLHEVNFAIREICTTRKTTVNTVEIEISTEILSHTSCCCITLHHAGEERTTVSTVGGE